MGRNRDTPKSLCPVRDNVWIEIPPKHILPRSGQRMDRNRDTPKSLCPVRGNVWIETETHPKASAPLGATYG